MIVKILVKMTTSNMDVIYSDMVTKVQQVRLSEEVCYFTYTVDTKVSIMSALFVSSLCFIQAVPLVL